MRFAASKRRPGDVLEGPGPATVEGRGGCRKEPTDLPTEGFAEIPTLAFAGAAPQASNTASISTEAAPSLAHRTFGPGAASREPHSRSIL
jgi:hypothetical protein